MLFGVIGLLIGISSPLYASEMDLDFVMRCDDLYCSGGAEQVTGGIRNEVGVVLPAPRVSETPLTRTRLNRQGTPSPAPAGGGGPAATSEEMRPEAGSISGTEDTGATTGSDRRMQGSSMPTGAGGNGMAAGGMNAPGGGQGANNLKAGYLYADDEASTPVQVPKGQKANSLGANPMINPVALNSQSASGVKSAEKSGSGRGLAANPGMLGETSGGSGGSGGVGSPATGAEQSLLGKIVKSLGMDSFFGGLDGARGAGGPPGAEKGALARGKGQPLPQAQALKDPRQILKENYERYGRGLASQIEFGSSQSFLFQSMCQHYVNYALKNRIPRNDSPCPLN